MKTLSNNIRKFIGAGLLLAAMTMASFAQPQSLKLRDSISISADVVRIGDLFEYAGEAADIAVFQAPSPGRSGVVNARRLAFVTRRHGLRWSNTQRIPEVIITRPGRLISNSEIRTAIIERIMEQRGNGATAGAIDLAFDRGIKPFYVPAHKIGDGVAVLRFDYEPHSGRFNATITAPAGDPRAEKRTFRGRAVRVVEIPVLTRTLKRGERIRSRDITIKRLPERRVGAGILRNASDIIGLSAKRQLPAGRSLVAGDVERPRLVKRGAIVTISMTVPGLKITARGRALEDGTEGDVITIRNANTNRKLEATVTGTNAVVVNPINARVAQLSPGTAQ